jgi:soluble lytic murein transglycosylase
MKKTLTGISVLIIFIFFVFSVFYFETPLSVIRPVFHKQIINYYCKLYKMDPLFVTAIIKEESKFLRRAHSHMGAIGLMQLMPKTARELALELGYTNFSEKDLESPKVNINLGMYYLYKLDKLFRGDKVHILASYNAGIGNVQSWQQKNKNGSIKIEDIPYKETKTYVQNVLRTYQWMKETQRIKKLIREKIA